MKQALLLLSLVCALCALPAAAAERPASAASVKRLIQVTQSQKMLDKMMAQLDQIMQASLQQANEGQSLSPAQTAVMAEMQTEMVQLFKTELTWESLEPIFIEVYCQAFTQKEIDAMLAFYKTKTGQAVIEKMPLVMQSTTQAMQTRMVSLMPKIQALANEGAEKMRFSGASPEAAPQPKE